MQVVLNVQSLAPPLTGIGRYTFQLLRALADNRHIERLHCFSDWGWLSTRQVLGNAAAGRFPEEKSGMRRASPRTVATRMRQALRALPGAYALRAEIRDRVFRWRANGLKKAVYHEPNYVFRPFPGPKVLTVHDISHLRYPQYHPRERVRHLEKRLPASMAMADRIITVSAFTKRELVDFLGVPSQKIVVIPLGADPVYHPRSQGETASVLERHGLVHGGYLLVVATLEPRKNLARLVRAFAQLPASLRERFPLVLAGPNGWGQGLAAADMPTLEAKGQIRRLGYVADADLPLLYAGAGAFAFPSLYEGFGLPPLEAMACGVPVLTSSASALPEVVGSAALCVDPQDVADIRAGLLRLLTDEAFRRRARQAGPERAARFTWKGCAEQTASVYAEVFDETYAASA